MSKLIAENEIQNIDSLKWYPWVGEKYFQLPPEQRILIMGESHYSINTPDKIKQWDTQKEQTRRVILELLDDTFTSKTHSRFHNLLLQQDSLPARKYFYQYVGFVNIIQRAMVNFGKNNIEKPKKKDFKHGWHVILDVIQILKPKYVLSIGVQAANTFNSIKGENIESVKLDWFNKINNTYPRKGVIKFKGGQECTFLFLKHMGRSISNDPWREHLKKNSNVLEIIKQLN